MAGVVEAVPTKRVRLVVAVVAVAEMLVVRVRLINLLILALQLMAMLVAQLLLPVIQ